jgi:CRISPR-associated protein Csh1
MITNFWFMGKNILERDGFYDQSETIQKRTTLLRHLSLIPNERKNTYGNAVTLHFDLGKKLFYFEVDDQIEPEKRDTFFAFKVGAPRDKKKFLATNNIESFLTKTVNDSILYLQDKRKNKKTAQWFKENISTDYDTLLLKLRDTFYQKIGDNYILNEQFLHPRQKDQLLAIRKAQEEKSRGKPKPASWETSIELLLRTLFNIHKDTKLPSIYLVKIDGKTIMEMDRFRDSYINLVYYDLFERFFLESPTTDKTCHTCGNITDVVGQNLPLPMKFYGTTNNLYFENAKNKNAHKSFAACKPCLTRLITGMQYTQNFLDHYLFDMNCFIVPNTAENDNDFENRAKSVIKLLKTRNEKYRDSIHQLQQLLKKSARRKVSFNLLFYHAEQASFNILKYIADIQLIQLLDKMQRFDDFTDRYQLDLLGKYPDGLRLTDIRFYLFPSKYSHNKPDPKLYGKDLLDFLENFLLEYKFNAVELMRRFTDIYKRRLHREKINPFPLLSPFKMVLFLTILHQKNMIKEETPMNKGDSVSEILKPEYREFFEIHGDVYGGYPFRQGLFLLGTIISKIIYKQKSKRENSKLSSTFLGKLNLEGIPPRRIPGLIGQVKEYCRIYNPYEERGIWGNLLDRLQGIQSSYMKAEEIVFYILTGISFQDYLGMKAGLDKALNPDITDDSETDE